MTSKACKGGKLYLLPLFVLKELGLTVFQNLDVCSKIIFILLLFRLMTSFPRTGSFKDIQWSIHGGGYP
jgi:hypothetical protein